MPVRIPERAAGQKIRIEVGGGDHIAPVMPEPRNLEDLIANVKRFYPPQSLVVGLDVPGEGITLRGRVLEQLPASAVAALKPAAGSEQLDAYRAALRQVVPLGHLVTGRETVRLTVAKRRER